jgi:hypothetical protein
MKPRLKVPQRSAPLDAIRAAKKVALTEDWTLRRWTDFAREAYATLDADASEDSLAEFWRVVGEWFELEAG